MALCKYRQRGLKRRERNANLDKRHKGVYFEIEFTLFRFIFQGLLKSKIAKINIDLSLFAVGCIYRNEINDFCFDKKVKKTHFRLHVQKKKKNDQKVIV